MYCLLAWENHMYRSTASSISAQARGREKGRELCWLLENAGGRERDRVLSFPVLCTEVAAATVVAAAVPAWAQATADSGQVWCTLAAKTLM